jgi:serine/threonine protein kinase
MLKLRREVHRLKSKGYTEAIDMWSMGVITLCLLTGDAIISFEELQTMSQVDVTEKLATANHDYPQWRHLNFHGKDFVKRLLVLEPQKRMTAKEAMNHDWFRKPERIAAELDKLYERATIFWSKRSNSIGIIEELQDVVGIEESQSYKGDNARRAPAMKMIPDAGSPYFSLERHLQPAGARTRSILRSKRKRILAELKEADSQFLVNPAQLEHNSMAINTRPKKSLPLRRKKSATDMGRSSPPILRPIEPSLTSSAIRNTLAAQPGLPTDTEAKRRESTMVISWKATMQGLNITATEVTESGKYETTGLMSANILRRPQFPTRTDLGIKQVDANDLFGTAPIEIKAAEAAEAAHAAYEDMYESFPYSQEVANPEDTLERPTKLLARGYTFSPEERELYDEAAKDLPKLSTAKAFSQAIAKRRELKSS